MTQPLSINLTDPTVQRMLGGQGQGLATGKRQVVQLAGDAPDPTGLTQHRGALSTTMLNGGKQEVVVVYKGMFMTLDVYALPGEPMKVHLYCPRCHKHSTVPGDRKAIDFDPYAPNPVRTEVASTGQRELEAVAERGRISIETFECPWEISDAPHVAGGLHTGANLCRLRLAIDNNRAREV